MIFPAECIFCDKKGRCKVKRKGAWTTEPLAKFEFGGGETVLKTAESENAYLPLKKIKGFDLFACEAQYHPSYHKSYTRKRLWLKVEYTAALEGTPFANPRYRFKT